MEMNRVTELRSLCEDSLDQPTVQFLKDCQAFSRALAYKLQIQNASDTVKNKVFPLLSPKEQSRLYDITYPHKVSAEKRELARQLIKDFQEQKRFLPYENHSARPSPTVESSDLSKAESSESQSVTTTTMSSSKSERNSGQYIDSLTSSSWSTGTCRSNELQDAGLRTMEELIKKREKAKEYFMTTDDEDNGQTSAGYTPYKRPTKVFEKAEISFHSSSDGHTFSRMTFDEAYANTTQSLSTIDPLSLQAIQDHVESAKRSRFVG